MPNVTIGADMSLLAKMLLFIQMLSFTIRVLLEQTVFYKQVWLSAAMDLVMHILQKANILKFTIAVMLSWKKMLK